MKHYYAEHPKMAERAGKDGFIKVIEEDHIKIEVLNSLPSNIVGEIWRAAQDMSVLKEGEKNA